MLALAGQCLAIAGIRFDGFQDRRSGEDVAAFTVTDCETGKLGGAEGGSVIGPFAIDQGAIERGAQDASPIPRPCPAADHSQA